MTGDDAESRVRHRMQHVEDMLEELPRVQRALLTLSRPDSTQRLTPTRERSA
ncbi:hypothetical protein [Brachybacterium sacelli]|uniref:MarR family transcriptional regulator n=1 Tax=Brachybacterium sacelli TaxID=173364 RepID=A0ABS4X6D2_9MICO|nr:hypothetical protein [Brachybacterium sacelli]MBP2384028.1 hypothetical protein [Brachybacterium sacelli]